MGARHSSRRDLLFNNSDGAGDAPLAARKSTHRSSSSSGKLRSRWSKLARSHSDRTPAPLCTDTFNNDETAATNDSRNFTLTEGCLSISVSCQTEIQLVSVMTQTEHNELLDWKVANKGHSCLTFDSPSKELDIGNCSNFDSSHMPICRMPDDSSKLHCIRQESLRHITLVEAKSYPCDNKNYSSVVYSENHMKEHSCPSDVEIDRQSGTTKYLPSEIDGACNAVENFESETKAVQESSRVSHGQKQITSVGADIIQLHDKRKQSYSSESKSVTENAIDLGSSFASLNSEDMMFDTETDHTLSPTSVRSRHSSVDAWPVTHPRRITGHLMNSKYAAVPDCHHDEHDTNEVVLQMDHSISRKHSVHECNENMDPPKHSESAEVDGNIKTAVNGWSEVDEVTDMSPTEATCRFIL